MSWRDKYRQASFKGAAFHVADAGMSAGRRTHVHEYALRDIPFVEDLGRKAREFTISGYVLGPDYFPARDALLEACETSGSGELVHPYRGAMQVVCLGASFTESRDNGGMCEVALTFIEAGEQEFPSSVDDYEFKIDAASQQLRLAAIADTINRMVVVGVPEYVRASAGVEIGKLTTILAASAFPGADMEALASFRRLVGNLEDARQVLTSSPIEMAEQIVDAIRSVRLTSRNGNVPVLDALSLLQPTPTGGQTLLRRIARDNAAAVVDLIVRASLTEKANAVRETSFATYEDALRARDELTDALDRTAEIASDRVFSDISDLRALVVEAVPAPGSNLPRISNVNLAETIPAVVLAYSLYDDVTRDAEIVARNRVRNPSFLPGGRTLEVLSRE